MNTEHAPAGGPRGRRLARVIVAVGAWALVAFFAWLIWPTSLGGQTTLITVSGHSMEPLYYGGDIVVARTGTPRVGDIVIYNPEGYGDAKVIHRIIGGDGVTGWEIQGDNNEFVDPFSPTNDSVVGIAALHLPKLGVGVALLSNPWVWGSLMLLAVVFVLWPGRADEDKDERDDDMHDNDDGGPGADRESEKGAADSDLDAPLTVAEKAVLAMILAVDNGFRRLAPRRRPTALGTGAAAVIVTLSLAGVGAAFEPASASQLVLTATGSTNHSEAYCWPAATSITSEPAGTATSGSYTQVRILNVPAVCAGKTATVSVRNSSGAVLATATVTLASGSNVVTLGSSYLASAATHVIVTAGAPRVAAFTAALPAASCAAIDPSGNVSTTYACTVSVSPSGGPPWSNPPSTQYWNYTFNVTWTTTPPATWRWRVTLNQAVAPFPGFTPIFVGMYSNPGIALAPGYACTQRPLLRIQSTSVSTWGASLEIGNASMPGFGGTILCN